MTMRRAGVSTAATLSCARTPNRAVPRRSYASSSTLATGTGPRLKVTPCTVTKSLILDSPELGFKETTFPYIWLRDACQAPHSVHSGTKQKLFQTSDIDPDIEPVQIDFIEELESLRIVWDRDLRQREAQTRSSLAERECVLPLNLLRRYRSWESWRASNWEQEMQPITWDRKLLGMGGKCLLSFHALAPNHRAFASFLPCPADQADLWSAYPVVCSDASGREAAIGQLIRSGIVFFSQVPTECEQTLSLESCWQGLILRGRRQKAGQSVALSRLGDMVGDIRRTWYGDKVWDVMSVKDSKNIAYTNLDLGLHMDLV
jgi:gamma-butyrobetaine dioxygenase